MIKRLLPVLLFLFVPFGALAETQQGLELAPQAMRQKHLDHFMDVYRQFCYERHSRETVKSLLLASGVFRPAEDFEGVFEEMFDGIYCWNTTFGYFDGYEPVWIVGATRNAYLGLTFYW